MKELYNLILQNAAFYDGPINEVKLKMFAEELKDLPLSDVDRAYAHFRREPGRRFLPMPADVRNFLRPGAPDGRPGAEEAWAMLPKREEDSCVWTDEMSEAYGIVCSLIPEDETAARMAFREKYTSLVAQARAIGRRVVWTPSLGFDVDLRDRVLVEALRLGRLTEKQVNGLLTQKSELPDSVKQLVNNAARGMLK